MTRGLVLAAHGSRVIPAVNNRITRLAQSCGASLGFDEAVACFHQGSPGFGDVLDGMMSSQISVVPIMSSEGYYCSEVLPNALQNNLRYQDVRIAISKPVGANPRLPELIAERARELITRSGRTRDNILLAVLGHGTRRHARSRATAVDVADQLAAMTEQRWQKTAAAFIDDEPGLETLRHARLCGGAQPDLIVAIPMFIGQGPHILEDIPSVLGFPPDLEVRFPMQAEVGEQTIVIDAPLGDWPAMERLVYDGVQEVSGKAT